MKAILKFDLPEETDDFRAAINGPEAIAVISDIDRYLRSMVKYADNDTSIDIASYQAIRDELRRLLEEYGISID